MIRIKTFISDMKIIFKLDKDLIKLLLSMTIFCLIFSAVTSRIHEDNLFLFLNFIPVVVFFIAYRGKYYPLFREIEKELELENKYQYFYNKFLYKI